MATTRRTYKVTLNVSIEVDDEPLTEVQRMVQEHVNELYYKMARDDIRVILQHSCDVVETP